MQRPFFYLEQHLIKGRSWPDMLALERDMGRFEQEWEQRPNQSTGEPPADSMVFPDVRTISTARVRNSAG